MAWLYEPPTNVTDATQMVGWINSATDLWLFQGIIAVVFIVSLVSMMKNQSNTISKSFASASFISMLISIMARTINLIPTWFMTLWIVMVGLSAVWMYVEGVN